MLNCLFEGWKLVNVALPPSFFNRKNLFKIKILQKKYKKN